MYNFIDVTEVSEDYVLPSEALNINGEYIENLISGYRTLNVQGREALSPDLLTYTTGARDGSRIKSKRFPERIIIVTYQLKAESNEAFREAYNKLGGILNVENARLIFNDEQDKFFIGTPCIIDAVSPGRNTVVGKFEILCVDPFKYSVLEYEAEPNLDEASILINYGGTYKAYPTLEADFYNEEESNGESVTGLTGAGDCGYVAFFTEDEKIIQLGNPEEVDGEEAYEKSQTLVNSQFNKSTSWGSAAKSLWKVNSGITSSSAVVQAGSLKMGVASYTTETPKNTSATLLNVTSKAEQPYIEYKITAKTSDRKANSVKVVFSITAALATKANYWRNSGVLVGSVYVGGSWHNVTLKAASDKWNSDTAHTKNLTVTVTGLSESATAITGIKFKATRSDNLGDTGKLSETACGNLPISNYAVNVPDTYYLTPDSFGTGTDWHGPSITRVIPADAAGVVGAVNCTLSYSQRMAIGTDKNSTNQLGAFQVLLVSGSGSSRKIVAGVNVYKGNSGNKAKLRFYVNNTVVNTMDIDLSNGNKYFKSGNSSTITKAGNTINFNICGIKKTYRDDDIATVAVKEVTFTLTKFGTKTQLSHNGLYWAKFVKNNCDSLKDIPNKFGANDVLIADCKNGDIYLNGALSPDLGALGNNWEDFVLTPGLNQIGIAYSEWLEAGYAPTMKVRYREVFL